MKKRSLVVASLMALSFTALAGKLERTTYEKQVVPAVTAAQDTYKSSCGCALKINVDTAALTTNDELLGAKHIAEHLKEGVEKYCTDAPSKKAMCQMRTLEIVKAKPTSFTFKNGVGTCTDDGQETCAWEQMTKVLDK
ncbi:MAG TPA: hypothetical protein VFQ65_31460 [Kofleriaceae bacterium]|nr:hypothetical protein [Kofleriaceae bacterium]